VPVAPPARMANVFWLGGGCGSGKTTIARVLCRRLDLRLYPIDGYTYAHAERSKGGGFPLNRAAAELRDPSCSLT
jgi:cytidylate kinase